jgi:hypothetical protein
VCGAQDARGSWQDAGGSDHFSSSFGGGIFKDFLRSSSIAQPGGRLDDPKGCSEAQNLGGRKLIVFPLAQLRCETHDIRAGTNWRFV